MEQNLIIAASYFGRDYSLAQKLISVQEKTILLTYTNTQLNLMRHVR